MYVHFIQQSNSSEQFILSSMSLLNTNIETTTESSLQLRVRPLFKFFTLNQIDVLKF